MAATDDGGRRTRVEVLTQDVRALDAELRRPVRELSGHMSWGQLLDAAPSGRAVYLSTTRQLVLPVSLSVALIVAASVLMLMSSKVDVGLGLSAVGLGAGLVWWVTRVLRSAADGEGRWVQHSRRLLQLTDAVVSTASSCANLGPADDPESVELFVAACTRLVATLRRPPGVWEPRPGLHPGSGPSSAVANQMEAAIAQLIGVDDRPVAAAVDDDADRKVLLRGPLATTVSSDNRRTTWIITGPDRQIVGSIQTDPVPQVSGHILIGRAGPSTSQWDARPMRVLDGANRTVLIVTPEGRKRRHAAVVGGDGSTVGRIDGDRLSSEGELVARRYGDRYVDDSKALLAERSTSSGRRTLRFQDGTDELSRLLILADWSKDPQPLDPGLPD